MIFFSKTIYMIWYLVEIFKNRFITLITKVDIDFNSGYFIPLEWENMLGRR